jgi:hypothetical protein
MVIERLGSFSLKYLRKTYFSSARYLRAVWRFNFLNFLSELIFPYSPLSDLLFISTFFIRSFYFSLAFTSAFAAVSIILKEIIFLINWSDIARPFYVLKEFNFFRFEGRVIFDLRFFF